MAKTPFFGPFDVSRSPNFADNQLINLRPEISEVKQGRNIGALYGTAGLDLLVTCGGGPINGARSLGAALYVVSGGDIYSVDTAWTATLVGAIPNTGGHVSMIDNGTQLALFTDHAGFILPGGVPLTGGTISGGGANYTVGDTIVLVPNDGIASAAAIIEVAIVAAGVVTGFAIIQAGAFSLAPTGFVQKNTTGSGSGFTMSAPIYGPAVPAAPISLPFTPTGNQTMSAAFQDGFGLVINPNTMDLYQSLVGDLSVWPALNFATADGESDNLVALAAIHRQIFVVKQRTTEVWNDAGTTGFAFQPLGSVLIEHGAVSWGSVARLGETLIWLSQSAEGVGIVREIEGFSPRRVSTHAVETLLAAAPTLTDAFAYTYQQEGHQYYVLTLPSGNLTLVYDKTASLLAGVPMWHQWMAFANGTFSRHWGNAFVFFNQTAVLGDYRNGNLYRINLNTLTDNGSPRKWLRTWRAMQQAIMQPMRFSALEIDLQTGVGVPVGTDPQVMLRWSDDGGHNWSAQSIGAAGKPGQTAQRLKFNRLGSTRRNSGLDRIFELSSSDEFPVCLIGAELDV